MAEFPLVMFTVLSQVAVGGFIMMIFMEKRGLFSSSQLSSAAVAVFVCTLISMICSTTHLGDPAGAYRAMLHPATSWLSREIIFFGGFAAMSALYMLPVEPLRKVAGPLGVLLGLLGVVSSIAIYTIPSFPAWNSPFTAIQFLMTGALGGPMLIMAIMYACDQEIKDMAYYCLGGLLFIQLLVSMGFVSLMGDYMALNVTLLCARLFFGIAAPVGMMLLRQRGNEKYMPLMFASILLGEVFGRIIFYENVLPINLAF